MYTRIIKCDIRLILRSRIIDFIDNYNTSISSRKPFISKFNKLVNIFI